MPNRERTPLSAAPRPQVTSCHISVFYYVGFAYLMSRRYVDATRVLSQILFYIGRTKQYHTRSYMCAHYRYAGAHT